MSISCFFINHLTPKAVIFYPPRKLIKNCKLPVAKLDIMKPRPHHWSIWHTSVISEYDIYWKSWIKECFCVGEPESIFLNNNWLFPKVLAFHAKTNFGKKGLDGWRKWQMWQKIVFFSWHQRATSEKKTVFWFLFYFTFFSSWHTFY